jgi:hypothetical protein
VEEEEREERRVESCSIGDWEGGAGGRGWKVEEEEEEVEEKEGDDRPSPLRDMLVC